MTTKYCFDSSAFINSWRIHYDPKVFPSIWEKFDNLIAEDRIITCKEAWREVETGDDQLAAWLKARKKFIIPYDADQIAIVQSILGKYPKVSQYNKQKPIHADPFIVALAKAKGATVVTYERPNGSSDNPAIPSLCAEQEVECIGVLEFLRKEGISL